MISTSPTGFPRHHVTYRGGPLDGKRHFSQERPEEYRYAFDPLMESVLEFDPALVEPADIATETVRKVVYRLDHSKTQRNPNGGVMWVYQVQEGQ